MLQDLTLEVEVAATIFIWGQVSFKTHLPGPGFRVGLGFVSRGAPKARRTYSRFEPIVTVTTRPDRRERTYDRLLAQSAVITADSTGESGVAGRELLANQNIRNEGVAITREMLSWRSQSILISFIMQVSCF